MDNDPKGEGKEKASSPLREVLSWVVTLLAAFALAMVLKNYVIINATVPTGSMEHTIEPGDDLFGLRLAYQFSEPKRGDIVISGSRMTKRKIRQACDWSAGRKGYH